MCNAYNHPPGCTCGWGGDGHAGVRFDYSSPIALPVHTPLYIWKEREETRPTTCPECGEAVFFIRHNGGCVWVDPPLGWPWPKHGCFDKPSEPTVKFDLLNEKSSGLFKAKMAVVTKIRRLTRYSEPQVELRQADGCVLTVTLRWRPKDDEMLGDLIVFSEEDSLLIHPVYAEIAFHSLTYPLPPESPKKTAQSEWYKCARCKATVKNGTGHDDYCRNRDHRRKPDTTSDHKLRQRKVRRHGGNQNPKKPSQGQFVKPTLLSAQPPRENTKVRLVRPGHLTLEERIAQAIDEIASKSWDAVAEIQDSNEQWRMAKRMAMSFCSALSPSIRKQVRHAFDSQAWRPLMERKPMR